MQGCPGGFFQSVLFGLFKLKDELARQCDAQVPSSCRSTVRFILVTEISNIYKKNEKTRKNHNLVFVPDLDVAQKFSAKLDKIGNIKSDGRPILGLDSRDLLEICVEASEDVLFVPAHIWTPHFAVLGASSGFDTLEECFEDMLPHIFAVGDVIGGLMLCKNTTELVQQRRAHYANQSRSQMEAVDNNWMRENDARMPLLKPERKTQVTFGTGQGPTTT